MSSCLSGGGRTACAYAALDLELIKSHSPPPSSPSSTISESNCSHSPPLPLSTRKPRAQRKRPNQTYNEAAVLLSTAYPKVFSPKHLTNCKFTKPMHLHNIHNVSCTSTSSNNASGSVMFFDSDSSELLLPFRVIDHLGFPLYRPFIIQDRPCPSAASIDPKAVTTTSPCSEVYPENSSSCFSEQDEFDAESIILDDEEIEEGIDSILGNSSATNSSILEDSKENGVGNGVSGGLNFPIGLGFGGKFECGSMRMGKGVRPLRHQAADGGEWWRFPAIDVREISPKLNNNDVTATAATITAQPDKKKPKKKKKKTEKLVSLAELGNVTNPVEEETTTVRTEKLAEPGSSLLLKLNYEVVLNAWSDTGSAFPLPASELGENDSHARLAQIDLFDEGGGVRSARVLRYKEKRRTRLFSKKIRYEVRKVNADQRPRMKGRFVRRPNSAGSGGKR